MIGTLLNNVREKKPVVHCITNYVTANDCANIVLAAGGSPVMADSIEDVVEITPKCDALCINLGTLKNTSVEVMLKAGIIANRFNKPVVLDPTGAGASKFRLKSAETLLNEIKFSAVRGNISEIKALCGMSGDACGVDAAKEDESIENRIILAKSLAEKFDTTIILTGETDIVADKNVSYTVYGGNQIMSRFTGAGCMLSAITGAFMGANTGDVNACLAAVCTMAVCGEKAFDKMTKDEGTMAFKNLLIDGVYRIDEIELERGARYETGNTAALCGD